MNEMNKIKEKLKEVYVTLELGWTDDKGKKKKGKLDINEVAKIFVKNKKFITLTDKDKINDIYMYEEGIYKKIAETFIQKMLVECLERYASKYYIGEIINQIKIMTVINLSDIVTNNKDLVCLKNGVLNIKTKEILPYSFELIFFNKIPVSYNPKSECKKWKEFLYKTITKDEESLLKRFVGITLTRETSYKKALFLVGPPNTGKSTVLITILQFLGGIENCSAFLLQDLEDKTYLVELYDKIANIAPDLPYDVDITQTSTFKNITGGDPISARGLYKAPITFTPYCKLMFSANKMPRVRDSYDNAFFSRWVILEYYKYDFVEEGEDIPNYWETFTKDEEEMSGILNWALDGLKEIEIFGFGDVLDSKEKWMAHSDTVSSFCIRNLEITDEEKDYIEKKEVYNRYCRFCRKYGETPKENNSFHRELKTIFPEIEKYQPTIEGNQVQTWRYLKFK